MFVERMIHNMSLTCSLENSERYLHKNKIHVCDLSASLSNLYFMNVLYFIIEIVRIFVICSYFYG